MNLRTRKFVGTFATLGYLAAYCLIAMVIGGMVVVGKNGALQFVYYVVAGLAWIPGSMAIIRWMSRPDLT
jgi:hypothetical protein